MVKTEIYDRRPRGTATLFMISLQNYEFRHKMKIVLRERVDQNRMRKQTANRITSRNVPRKIFASLGRLLMCLSFFNEHNPAKTMHSICSTTPRWMPLHAQQLCFDSPVFFTLPNRNISIERHYRIFQSKACWRQSCPFADLTIMCVGFSMHLKKKIDLIEEDNPPVTSILRHADNHIINWKCDLKWYLFRLCGAQPLSYNNKCRARDATS